MNVRVRVSDVFRKAAKPLLKRYPSLKDDLLKFEQALLKNPELGMSLGSDLYKVRIAITSKGKGKSGGARVITYVETIAIREKTTDGNETIVDLVTIYDKSEVESISLKELKALIKTVKGTQIKHPA